MCSHTHKAHIRGVIATMAHVVGPDDAETKSRTSSLRSPDTTGSRGFSGRGSTSAHGPGLLPAPLLYSWKRCDLPTRTLRALRCSANSIVCCGLCFRRGYRRRTRLCAWYVLFFISLLVVCLYSHLLAWFLDRYLHCPSACEEYKEM